MGNKRKFSKQRGLAKIGALLALSSGALLSSVTDEKAQANETAKPTTSIQKDEKNKSDLEDDLKTKAIHKITLVENFPPKRELFETFGKNAQISEVHKTYDFHQIAAEKEKNVYYKATSYSQTQPILMKMDEFRHLIKTNKNIQVLPTSKYQLVSSHLYTNYAAAISDSANWKDSRITDNARKKTLTFRDKTLKMGMNFHGDGGVFIENIGFHSHLDLEAQKGNKQFGEHVKEDFIDILEHNLNVIYRGKKYQAIYHEGTKKIVQGKQTIDGYFTFSDSTHGLPLQINNRFIVISVDYGNNVESLANSLTLRAVQSYENTLGWQFVAPNITVGLHFVDELQEESTRFYQIEAKEQIIHSVVFKYVTVSL
ncbi:MAG: hypothetical protein LBV67_11115 [Streptococcaceae bacterium]|jgi:hypothetical protein|nr:hypothetical protein [Streptococcaceae bacterium]